VDPAVPRRAALCRSSDHVRRGYTHHGVYVARGRIVHYAGLVRGLRGGAVEEVSLEQFARGHAIGVRTDSTPRFEREDVVRRARSRPGEDRDHVLRNNCDALLRMVPERSQSKFAGRIDAWRRGAATVGMIDATARTTRSLLQQLRAIRVPKQLGLCLPIQEPPGSVQTNPGGISDGAVPSLPRCDRCHGPSHQCLGWIHPRSMSRTVWREGIRRERPGELSRPVCGGARRVPCRSVQRRHRDRWCGIGRYEPRVGPTA
jgi:hypothetical protein